MTSKMLWPVTTMSYQPAELYVISLYLESRDEEHPPLPLRVATDVAGIIESETIPPPPAGITSHDV